MSKICTQCNAPLATDQTFCRRCGTLTGVSGSDPTVMIMSRPGPNTASPWAQVGSTAGSAVKLPSNRATTQTGKQFAGRGDVVAATPFTHQQLPIPHAPLVEADDLDGNRTRIVNRANGVNSLSGWMVALTGNDAGKDWRIRPGKNTIGRGTSVDIGLADDSVSTLHALLWIGTNGTATLVDRDSSNGTFIDQSQVFVPTTIEHGSLIRFGERSVLQWVVFSPAKRS